MPLPFCDSRVPDAMMKKRSESSPSVKTTSCGWISTGTNSRSKPSSMASLTLVNTGLCSTMRETSFRCSSLSMPPSESVEGESGRDLPWKCLCDRATR